VIRNVSANKEIKGSQSFSDRFENVQATALTNLRLAAADGDFDLGMRKRYIILE
jgi:hypothetical protein